jgi:hypothetical protein
MCTCSSREKDIFVLFSIFDWRISSLKITLRSLNLQGLSDKKKESLLSAIYIGSVFIVFALVYYIHIADNLWEGLIDFFTSLTLATVPTTGISLPAPANPAAHINLYTAAFHFTVGLGILEIVILLLRVGLLHSSVSRIAETIENIVFWLGTSYLILAYLMNMTLQGEWFIFWAGLILIFGLALIARAFVLLTKR